MNKSIVLLGLAAVCCCAPYRFTGPGVHPLTIVTNDPPFYGPYNGVFLPDGEGLIQETHRE